MHIHSPNRMTLSLYLIQSPDLYAKFPRVYVKHGILSEVGNDVTPRTLTSIHSGAYMPNMFEANYKFRFSLPGDYYYFVSTFANDNNAI